MKRDTEMITQFSREELMFGKDAVEKLKNSRVAIFGIGGVGGYVAESLARGGVGKIDLIDNDTVSITNLNRQIFALHSTIGKLKTHVARDRIKDINPDCDIQTYEIFYLPENSAQFDLGKYDYIIDAIDTVSGKIELAVNAQKANVPIISSMGTGNKVDPTQFEVCDIYKTSICPLARVMRRELKQRGIKKLKTVYSKEIPLTPKESSEEISSKRQIPASNSFVPPVAGLIIAGEVIKDLIKEEKR